MRTATYQIDGLTTGDRTIYGAAAQDAWCEWCCGIHGRFDMSFDSDSYDTPAELATLNEIKELDTLFSAGNTNRVAMAPTTPARHEQRA